MFILIYDFGGNNFKNMLSSKENSNNKKKHAMMFHFTINSL